MWLKLPGGNMDFIFMLFDHMKTSNAVTWNKSTLAVYEFSLIVAVIAYFSRLPRSEHVQFYSVEQWTSSFINSVVAMTISSILDQRVRKGSILWECLHRQAWFTLRTCLFAMPGFVLDTFWKRDLLKMFYMKACSRNGFNSWDLDICEYNLRLVVVIVNFLSLQECTFKLTLLPF